MGDSEVSRILSRKASGNLLSAVTGLFANPSVMCSDIKRGNDVIAYAWGRWHAARLRQNLLCRRQQRLENRLLRSVGGFPHVELSVPDRAAPVFAQTADEIDRLLPGTEMKKAREVAKADLAKIRKAWEIADSKLGYSTACATENLASARAIGLAADLFQTKTASIRGVIAKLHCLIEMEDPGASLSETPWPELRLLLCHLLELEKSRAE